MCVYPKGAGQLEVQCPVKAVRAVPLELWKTVNLIFLHIKEKSSLKLIKYFLVQCILVHISLNICTAF